MVPCRGSSGEERCVCVVSEGWRSEDEDEFLMVLYEEGSSSGDSDMVSSSSVVDVDFMSAGEGSCDGTSDGESDTGCRGFR